MNLAKLFMVAFCSITLAASLPHTVCAQDYLHVLHDEETGKGWRHMMDEGLVHDEWMDLMKQDFEKATAGPAMIFFTCGGTVLAASGYPQEINSLPPVLGRLSFRILVDGQVVAQTASDRNTVIARSRYGTGIMDTRDVAAHWTGEMGQGKHVIQIQWKWWLEHFPERGGEIHVRASRLESSRSLSVIPIPFRSIHNLRSDLDMAISRAGGELKSLQSERTDLLEQLKSELINDDDFRRKLYEQVASENTDQNDK